MAKRTKSVTTLLKEAKAELAAQSQEVEKLKKDLANKTAESDRWYKSRGEFEEEIKQVHTLLDALPNCIPRQSEPGEYGGRVSHALMTRLAAWLAVRGRAPAQEW